MIVRLLDKFEIPLWEELIRTSTTGTHFQTPQWIQMWATHFSSVVQIYGVFDNEHLIGVGPFIEREDTLQFAAVAPVQGTEMLSDYGDVTSIPGREKEVWEALIGNASINNESMKPKRFELNFLREDSPSLEILKSLGGSVEDVDVSPYLALPKAWDEYISSLDRHDRHELRRKTRKVEAEGITFVPHIEHDSFEIFLTLMASSSEEKQRFLSEKMRSYFHDIYKTYFPKGTLRIYYLKKGDQAIAAVLLFVWKGEMLLYNSGFNPEFGYIAPGLVLNGYVIRRAIEEGFACYDFLRGNERYKYDIGGIDRKLYKIII